MFSTLERWRLFSKVLGVIIVLLIATIVVFGHVIAVVFIYASSVILGLIAGILLAGIIIVTLDRLPLGFIQKIPFYTPTRFIVAIFILVSLFTVRYCLTELAYPWLDWSANLTPQDIGNHTTLSTDPDPKVQELSVLNYLQDADRWTCNTARYSAFSNAEALTIIRVSDRAQHCRYLLRAHPLFNLFIHDPEFLEGRKKQYYEWDRPPP